MVCTWEKMNIKTLFNKPQVVGLVGNQDEGKSNFIYYTLEELSKDFDFEVYTYGLRCNFPNTIQIYSVTELEQIKDSIIILDEISSLFNLTDRKVKSQIEKTIRLISHNNNILLLSGLAENYPKFLSAKLSVVILKKITLADLINGSRVKNIVMNYNGNEKGSAVLELPVNQAIVYDGKHYTMMEIPYFPKYDTKVSNVQICVPKNVQEKKSENIDYVELGGLE